MTRSRHAPLEDQLAAVPLLQDLERGDLARIAQVAARIQEPKGEILTKEGEAGHELMILLDGTVEVRHGRDVIATLGPGDVLGEIALLDGDARRSATAVATSNVTLAFVARHDVERLLGDIPVLAERIRAFARARHER
jgi:CRP/FNR family transcriptional regulator, cyclic AMP receptor protein